MKKAKKALPSAARDAAVSIFPNKYAQKINKEYEKLVTLKDASGPCPGDHGFRDKIFEESPAYRQLYGNYERIIEEQNKVLSAKSLGWKRTIFCFCSWWKSTELLDNYMKDIRPYNILANLELAAKQYLKEGSRDGEKMLTDLKYGAPFVELHENDWKETVQRNSSLGKTEKEQILQLRSPAERLLVLSLELSRDIRESIGSLNVLPLLLKLTICTLLGKGINESNFETEVQNLPPYFRYPDREDFEAIADTFHEVEDLEEKLDVQPPFPKTISKKIANALEVRAQFPTLSIDSEGNLWEFDPQKKGWWQITYNFVNTTVGFQKFRTEFKMNVKNLIY